MSEITYQEYWAEVESIAENMVDEEMSWNDNDRDVAEEAINDHTLHETIDGHQWVIYYAYNLDVIRHSDNEDYMNENFGSEALSSALESGGLNSLHTAIAFWALYADVSEKLEAAFDKYEEENDE